MAVLTDHREKCEERAAAPGVSIEPDGFISPPPRMANAPLKPAYVTQRYDRLAARLGIETTLHELRHYSATELIRAGVDIRTVADRLGHAGGTTTL